MGLRGWRVVVVTYLAGTPLHGPPVTSLSFPPWSCHLSVGIQSFFVIHCCISSLSSVSGVSCHSLSSIVVPSPCHVLSFIVGCEVVHL